MTAIIKERLHSTLAEVIYNEIQTGFSRFYYFLGQTLDLSSDMADPRSDFYYENNLRNNIIALKLINVNDVSFVIPRVNWVTDTRYAMYESSKDETLTNFYVLNNSNFNVYKCLYNNEGNISNVAPEGTSSDPFVTSDGYKWKFMYNIPIGLREKFLTTSLMPVSNSLKNRFYSNGNVESVTIHNGGSDYIESETNIVVQSAGTLGSGAVINPIVTGGVITSIDIVQPGAGYVNPTCTVSATVGTGASLSINMSRGDLNTSQSIVEALAINGTIDSYSITNRGLNYTTASVTITGDGSGATASVTVVNGTIDQVLVTNRGIGYTWATVTITGDGSDATVKANVSPLFGHSRDAIKELNARSLMFYTSVNQEKLAGFTINNDYRQFGLIRNPRSFQYSTALVNHAAIRTFGLTGVFDPLLFPIGTTLSDEYPVTGDSKTYSVIELTVSTGTTHGMLIEAINNGEVIAGQPLYNTADGESFEPLQSLASNLTTGNYLTTCYVSSCSFSAIDYPDDTVLLKDNKRFVVVATMTGKMLLNSIDGAVLYNGDTLINQTINATITMTLVTTPSVDKKSGDILFIDNRASFVQSDEQTITFRTVIKF